VHTIEVDFAVFKALTARRAAEHVTYNDVIRELLKLEPRQSPSLTEVPDRWPGDWIVKGVRFAEGTQFRAQHNGRLYQARVEKSALALDGKRYDSPSAAAVSITGYAVNGWNFWEFLSRRTGDWRLMASARKTELT
jgi:hypothetical protein